MAEYVSRVGLPPSGSSEPEGSKLQPTGSSEPVVVAQSQTSKELDETLKSFVVPGLAQTVEAAGLPAGGSLPAGPVVPYQSPGNVPPGRAQKDRDAIAVLEAIGRRNEGVMGNLSHHGVVLPGGTGSSTPVARNIGPDATVPSEYCGGAAPRTYGLPDKPLPDSVRGDGRASPGAEIHWARQCLRLPRVLYERRLFSWPAEKFSL